jgi:hypothetical protein
MTMSVTITSNPEEISNISTAVECLDFILNFAKSSISYPDREISLDKIKDTRNYLASLLSILNTKGMSIEDYEALMNALED